MASYSAPAILPRLPSGIDGLYFAAVASTREMISSPAVRHVDHRAAAPARHGLGRLHPLGERSAAAGTLEREGLRGRPAGGLGVAQVLELERFERQLGTDEEERRRFAVIDRRERAPVGPQVDEDAFPAGADLERQLALPGDDVRALDVADLVRLTVELDLAAGLERLERRELARAAQKREEVGPHRVRQPAGALIVEEAVPLVPGTRCVAVLDPADQREVDALVAALGAELEGRRLLDELRHLADVLEVRPLLDEGRAAELADRDDRRGAPEPDRCAAGGAVRGRQKEAPLDSPGRACRAPRWLFGRSEL